MLLALSMDGTQLYQNKESDTWFGVATVIDFAPEIRHAKEMVLPLFVIGGPNAPRNYDSFLFPTFVSLLAKILVYRSGTLRRRPLSKYLLGLVLELQIW